MRSSNRQKLGEGASPTGSKRASVEAPQHASKQRPLEGGKRANYFGSPDTRPADSGKLRKVYFAMAEAYGVASPQTQEAYAELREVEEKQKARPVHPGQGAERNAGTEPDTAQRLQGGGNGKSPAPGSLGSTNAKERAYAEAEAVYDTAALLHDNMEHKVPLWWQPGPEAIASMRAALDAHYGPMHERARPEETGSQATQLQAAHDKGAEADAALRASKRGLEEQDA